MTNTTNQSNQAATSGMSDVIEAMRSIQTESDRWRLAESLVAMIPSGLAGFSDIVDAATAEGLGASLSANTLRLYRDAAVRWPADQRVKNVSFSAHREAMVLPSIKEAAKMLSDLAKNLGAEKVTVASVRKAIAVKQGKAPKAGAAAATAPRGPSVSNVISDLMAGGPQLIAAIPATTESGELDKLQVGLTKVIAHVERLRAKAARKSAAASKSAAPASKAAAAKGVAKSRAAVRKSATRKSQGDLRGL